MERLQMCRVCLNENVQLKCISNTKLQEIYQKLTSLPLKTEDQRPLLVCYVCVTLLRKAHWLMMNCLLAEEWFTKVFAGLICEKPKMGGSRYSAAILPPVVIDGHQSFDIPQFHADSVFVDIDMSTTEMTVKDVKVERLWQENDGYDENADNKLVIDIEREHEVYVDAIKFDVDMAQFPVQDGSRPAKKYTPKTRKKRDSNVFNKSLKIKREDNKIKKLKKGTAGEEFQGVVMCEARHCRNCFTNVESYKAHLESHAELDQSFKCDFCQKEYRNKFSKQSLYRHMKTHITKNKLKCNMCDKAYFNRTLWKDHMRIHENKTYECNVCMKSFKLEKYLKRHSDVYHNLNTFKCDKCPRAYFNKSKLEAHVESFHNGRPFPCSVCGEVFPSANALSYHRRVHIHKTIIYCDKCSKVFTNSNQFEIHSRMHSGERPFVCDVCDKSYSCRSALAKHMKKHPINGVFTCNICNETFIERDVLLLHQRSLHVEYQHKCTICHKVLSTAQHLNKHMLIHTGERPFKCNLCSKSFRAQETLRDHIRTHTGEKPYICMVCEKSFSQRTPLVVHMRSSGHGLTKVKDE